MAPDRRAAARRASEHATHHAFLYLLDFGSNKDSKKPSNQAFVYKLLFPFSSHFLIFDHFVYAEETATSPAQFI